MNDITFINNCIIPSLQHSLPFLLKFLYALAGADA
jgi:hypothetical protein